MAANEPAQALFERAEFAIPTAPSVHRLLADPELEDLVQTVAERFAYAVV